MKDLIDAIITFLEAAITAGTIDSSAKVHKGLYNDPSQIPYTDFPYICVDDGGERTEVTSTSAQMRYYIVNIEMGVYDQNVESALDDILDFCNQVKAVFETKANRQKDGMTWGVVITPFAWEKESEFYRGRHVAIEFKDLEMIYDDF